MIPKTETAPSAYTPAMNLGPNLNSHNLSPVNTPASYPYSILPPAETGTTIIPKTGKVA